MTFRISPEIFNKYPDVRIGVLFLSEIDNAAPENFRLIKQIQDESQRITQEFSLDTVSQVPFISRWREIFRSFGAKPSDYRSSIENLIRMALKGRILGHINSLVDIYNFVSLKYKLPIGGEDTDKMVGDLQLTFASESEQPVQLLGDQEAEKPFFGEVIYKDEAGVICRCWNWREGARTMLTKETKNAILVIEASCAEEYEKLEKALDGLTTLVTHFIGGKVQRAVLMQSNASVSV